MGVTPQFYSSIQSYVTSDHKPVVAELNTKVSWAKGQRGKERGEGCKGKERDEGCKGK